ncbi:TetR-like C-terminal domain-containing protein [Nocardia rhizosphaerae]|uniref:TetR-like C-terminal domain-containing protein n=1 Tax=Nocardia rhizosphaerae TaxID=1691571 RepID=A0ABV8L853_9NOCA
MPKRTSFSSGCRPAGTPRTIALAEPGWFAVAFFGAGDASPESVRDSPAYLALADALDMMFHIGDLDPAARQAATWSCWSTVHGFAELALRGPLRHLAHAELQPLRRAGSGHHRGGASPCDVIEVTVTSGTPGKDETSGDRMYPAGGRVCPSGYSIRSASAMTCSDDEEVVLPCAANPPVEGRAASPLRPRTDFRPTSSGRA